MWMGDREWISPANRDHARCDLPVGRSVQVCVWERDTHRESVKVWTGVKENELFSGHETIYLLLERSVQEKYASSQSRTQRENNIKVWTEVKENELFAVHDTIYLLREVWTRTRTQRENNAKIWTGTKEKIHIHTQAKTKINTDMIRFHGQRERGDSDTTACHVASKSEPIQNA